MIEIPATIKVAILIVAHGQRDLHIYACFLRKLAQHYQYLAFGENLKMNVKLTPNIENTI
jgi:hypothetical protein